MVKDKSFKYENNKLSHTLQTLEFITNVIKLQQEPEEVIILINMNTKNEIIGFFEVSRGVIDIAITSIREIFKRVILSNSTKFILVHNHPSGDVTPSKTDKLFTEELQEVSELFNINFLDHLIVADDKYYSFMESGNKTRSTKTYGK